MIAVTERRVVRQDWHETDTTKTGWDSHGWRFDDDGRQMDESWTIIQHVHSDKFGNPLLAIAEKKTDINRQ